MADVKTVTGYLNALDALSDRRLEQSMYSECDVLMDRVVLTLHGEEHALRRAIEWKLFRQNFNRYYEREVYPVTLKQTLAPYLTEGRMDLKEFGFRVNINLSADLSGIDRPAQTEEETDLLVSLSRKFGEGATLFHSTRAKDQVRAEVSEAITAFREQFWEPSRARRQAIIDAISEGRQTDADLPRDILTVLLVNRDKQQLDDAMILREIAFFMQAGAHSSSNTLAHAFHEIEQWCSEHPEDRLRIQQDPFFLQRCIHESLRLHPASPVAWRSAGCPFQLPDGQTVESSDAVVIDLLGANSEIDLFGHDAKAFNPHREVDKKVAPYGLSFGMGIHTCFGRDLAGGAIPSADADPETHHFGTLTSLLRNLYEVGARPDPDSPPTADEGTQRQNWGRYPILLGTDGKGTI